MTVKEKVEAILAQVRPSLQADGGDVELLNVTADGVVQVTLKGACGSCPFSTMTLKNSIEARIIEAMPEIKSVVSL